MVVTAFDREPTFARSYYFVIPAKAGT